ncbi:MAG: TldD/PmbA family protein [Acidobacteriota bacterium]|nr:TldD/PmbA family protein [Acidobacteriota bacterium]
MKRRDFVKTLGATGVALYASDLVGDLIAQSPRGRVMESRFKGLSDIALSEARRLGCSYADIRFTRNVNDSVAVRDRIVTDSFGFGAGGMETSAGFGVRVIHSGVWGFASSPFVTEGDIKKITALATEVAKASAISKRFEVKLAPVQAYQDYWAAKVEQKPEDVSLDDKIAFLMKINEAALKVPGVIRVQSNMAFDFEWKYLATSEGSYIEQEIYRTSPGFTVTALKDGKAKSRTFSVAPKSAGYEVVLNAKMLENVERIAAEAVEHCTAPPAGVGLKDLIMTPAHAMLTIHEIVAHPTELDRVVGYEANYAGTSFVKASDVGKLMMGSKLFNVTCDRTLEGGMCTVGYDDDGVKSQSWPLIREGKLVDLQTNRETAHYIGQNTSKGCTFATSWRNYPFLRMPNVHVDAGPPGSPTPEEIIADTKDGILIDGRGSYSIDQQRYNGQFGGDAYWEIKNGKKTRMLSDVTYNAITTDFWQNLDATSGKESWEMFGTTGDAKGQPVQINHPSHGSPWCRIRRIMVGAAFS